MNEKGTSVDCINLKGLSELLQCHVTGHCNQKIYSTKKIVLMNIDNFIWYKK